MRSRWSVLAIVMVMGCALSAFAGPQIGVLDPTCNTSPGPHGPGSYNFGVTSTNPDGSATLPSFSPVSGGGTFTFCNLTQSYWTSVNFSVNNFGIDPGTWNFGDPNPAPGSNMITCTVGSGDDQSFLHCSVQVTNSTITMSFFGTQDGQDEGHDVLGIRTNHTMTVTLNTGFCETGVNGCTDGGDWINPNGGAITFSGSANGVSAPEPASMLLLGTGFAAVLLRRRKRS